MRSVLDPPWSLRIHDEAPLTVVAIVRGGALVLPDAAAPARLGPGDVAILRGPDHYTVADDPDHAGPGDHPPRPAVLGRRRPRRA